MSEAIHSRLNKGAEEFQKLQAELEKVVEARQRLDSQIAETEQVRAEFNRLEDGDDVFKLIGPVLVKQDRNEAKMNVDKRVDFIKKEIERVEKQIKDIATKSEKKKSEVISLQQELQELQGPSLSIPVSAGA